MTLKKALIITYYWPPTAGAGVQRWLKFTKYFRGLGIEPIIYTPQNPDFPIMDESLLQDVLPHLNVLKSKINEPYNLYRKILRLKKTEVVNQGFISKSNKQSFFKKVLIWVRGNFFIPDARVGWIKPSVRYLSKIIAHHQIDTIISTGPPHSMHVIALKLKQQFATINWIADFRDPWTQIDFYKDLKLTKWADKKHKYLELEVLKTANHIVTVSPNCALELTHICNRKIEVITNGFDESDFNNTNDEQDVIFSSFELHHIGALNKDRNPNALWKAIYECCEDDVNFENDLKLSFTGKTDACIFDDLLKYNLVSKVYFKDYVNHHEAIKLMQKSTILLLLLNNTPKNKGILTGKLFEYLAAKRPILAIGSVDGDAAKIINDTQVGITVDFNDIENMKIALKAYYQKFKLKQLFVNSQSLEVYSRKQGAYLFSKLILST